jgi:hypothetical protein
MSWPHDRLKVTHHLYVFLTSFIAVTAADLHYALLQLAAASARLYAVCAQDRNRALTQNRCIPIRNPCVIARSVTACGHGGSAPASNHQQQPQHQLQQQQLQQQPAEQQQHAQ